MNERGRRSYGNFAQNVAKRQKKRRHRKRKSINNYYNVVFSYIQARQKLTTISANCNIVSRQSTTITTVCGVLLKIETLEWTNVRRYYKQSMTRSLVLYDVCSTNIWLKMFKSYGALVVFILFFSLSLIRCAIPISIWMNDLRVYVSTYLPGTCVCVSLSQWQSREKKNRIKIHIIIVSEPKHSHNNNDNDSTNKNKITL